MRSHSLYILLIAVAMTQYTLANFASFNFDDYALVVENPPLRDFHELPAVLAAGKPIRGLTLMLDYALFGLDARGYHLDNVLWHFLGTVAFYFLVYRLFRNPRLAGVSALLFALHPVHVEAVMGIANRMVLIAFTFMMLAYHAWLSQPRFPVAAPVLMVLGFLLGLLSKQVAIAFPAVLVFAAWARREPGQLRRAWPWLIPLFLLGALALLGGVLSSAPILRDFNAFGRFSPGELRGAPYFRVLATSLSVFPRELATLFFPVHLCADPQIKMLDFSDWRAWAGAAGLLGLFALAVRTRRDFLVSFSLAWIGINLLPVMNWIPANAFFAERYLYIPSAGFCLLVAGLWERIYAAEKDWLPPLAARFLTPLLWVLILALCAFSPLTERIHALWPPGKPYFADAAASILLGSLVMAALVVLALGLDERAPRMNAWTERGWAEFILIYVLMAFLIGGTALLTEAMVGRRLGLPRVNVRDSLAAMNEWLARHARPGPLNEPSALFPTGNAAAELFNIFAHMIVGPAAVVFAVRRVARKAAAINPRRRPAIAIIFLVLLAMADGEQARNGDWTSDVKLWRSTVREEPRSILGWNNLGKAYVDRRRFDLAVAAFQRAVQLDPASALAYRNLGIACLGTGNWKGAEAAFAEALKRNPSDGDSRLNLANLFLADAADEREGCQKAIPHYLAILEQDPRSAHAHYNLAYCYYKLQEYSRARDELARALIIAPHYEKALNLLAQLPDRNPPGGQDQGPQTPPP